MQKIRISEVFFFSCQGEGLHVGVPSIFLRTFGCNLTCDKFGRKDNNDPPERTLIDVSNYERFEDLPLVKTGCDSYASWDTRFKKFSQFYDTYELASKIETLLPNQCWYDSRSLQEIHLVITGGEPLLGWQRVYPELLDNLNVSDVTFETNGTQILDKKFIEYVNSRFNHNPLELTFSISPKLYSSSGEPAFRSRVRGVIASFNKIFGSRVYLKFVVDRETNFDEIQSFIDFYQEEGFTGRIYLMPSGGIPETYQMNSRWVAEEALRRGWCYSPRLQIDIFGNQWGT